MAAAFPSLLDGAALRDGLDSNIEPKLEHHQGVSSCTDLALSFPALGGCGSQPLQCACRAHLACRAVSSMTFHLSNSTFCFSPHDILVLLERAERWQEHGSSPLKAGICSITWLTELRLWEKHQMFMCPEINLWNLAALLLAVPGRGGESTPRLLLLRISVLKMTRLIQPQIWASHTELPQVPYHSMPRYGGMKPPRWLPADFTWEADLWQSQHTQGKVQGEIGLVGIGIHFDIRPVRRKVHCSSDTSGFGCSGLKFSHEKSWWKGIIFNT